MTGRKDSTRDSVESRAASRPDDAHAGRPTPTLTALTVAQAAKVLSAAGGRRITEETLRADVDAGAPVNTDGTVNLVHYAAWLVREAAGGGGQGEPDGD